MSLAPVLLVAVGASLLACTAPPRSIGSSAPSSSAAEEHADVGNAQAPAQAVAELLARPEEAQDARWLALLDRAARAAWQAQDARTAKAGWERVLAIRSRTLPSAHPDLQRTRQELADALTVLGELRGALALEELSLEADLATLPEDSHDLQASRSNLAATRFMLGDIAGARELQEQVVEVYTRTLPADHRDLQVVRGNLAITLNALGDHAHARVLLEGVLESLSRTLPPDDPDVQGARTNLAQCFMDLGERQAARALQEQVLEIYSGRLPDDHPDVLLARRNLAGTLLSLGEVERPLELLRGVHDTLSRTVPDDHPDLQAARQNLAIALVAVGDLPAARVLVERALEVMTRTHPDDHPDLQRARGNLAEIDSALGRYSAARGLQEKVLAVFTRTLPADDLLIQVARGALATTLKDLGELDAARKLHEQALQVLTARLPDDDLAVLTARQGLALTLVGLGDIAGARSLLEQVLDSASRTLPETHTVLQAARTNYAMVIRLSGDLAQARALYEAALEAYSQTLPDEHPDLQRARHNVALCAYLAGDYEVARALQEQVVEIATRTRPADDGDLQRHRMNLAATLHALGELEPALALHEEVLAVRERTLPEGHPELQDSRYSVAAGLIDLAARPASDSSSGVLLDRALSLLEAFARAQASEARQARVAAPGREAEQRCATLSADLDLLFSVALEHAGDPRCAALLEPVFTCAERTRAGALAAGRLGRASASSEAFSAARQRLQRASEELTRRVRAGTSSAEYQRALRERESAEQALLELARSSLGGGSTSLDLDGPHVRAALQPGTAAVTYRRFTRVLLGRADARTAAIPADSLCAFVLTPDAPAPLLFDLGPIEPVRAAVEAWRDGLRVAGGRGAPVQVRVDASDSAKPGDALRALVLDPLRPALAGARHLVLVPDDVLHLVAFDALPSGADGAQLVGGELQIEIRATLGELLDGLPASSAGPQLVALGGIEYGGAPDEPATAMLRGSPFEQGFPALPGTRAEVDGLQGVFTRGVGGPALVLTRSDATRDELLESAPLARWLHVATHGWYASSSIRSWEDPRPLDERTGLGVRLSGLESVQTLSPMQLCGIALAGANLPSDDLGRSPGLVSADELSTLDLSNCELAVLSACDTARGEMTRAGQGVASLQRALQVAGARSVITSLWKVPDEATKELMLDFYRRIWVEKQPKWKALWDAKMKLRNAQDEQGRPKYTPRDWAAWVLTGEPD